jgi:glycosyltransferase involved in cell wall biosynthesis
MTSNANRLKVLLVDPSLFTGPYDAALDEGLRAAGVHTRWATRPVRPGQERELPEAHADEFFYRRVDELPGWPAPLRTVLKGLSHGVGLLQLLARVITQRPDVVHVQWAVLPLLDTLALALIRCVCPVVFTVHDPVPYNGVKLSWAQRMGFDAPMRVASRLIVHTAAGRDALVERGIDPARIRVVPHGPLALKAQPTSGRARDPRWTFTVFGEIKPYKGIDLLIEALARLTPEERAASRVIVAGRARMDVAPLKTQAAALGLADAVEWRVWRHSEQEMADLFADSDSIVFPYRQIDASGVYFLVKNLRRWLIASRVGVFAQSMRPGRDGALVPVGDVAALAEAMADAISRRPRAEALPNHDTWASIGAATAAIYADTLSPRRVSVAQT